MNLEKLISGNLILFTSFLLAQTSAQPSVQTYYPQVYAEQQLVGKEMTAEKSLLSPKIQLDTELNRVQSDPVLRYATWGFAVYDPQTNKMITCYNENVPLVPASTTKLLTTDTAYSLLGKIPVGNSVGIFWRNYSRRSFEWQSVYHRERRSQSGNQSGRSRLLLDNHC